tara:strand:- start:2549 stop:3211 length:663 start_codon:yes stop_codon:yes gene_type:complete
MSKPITFLEAYEEAQSALPSQNTNDKTEFAKLLNRAAKRLVTRASMPNLITRVELTVATDSVSSGAILLDIDLYESLLSLRYECKVFDIVPASSLFLDTKIGTSSFIDDGVDLTNGNYHYYSVPIDNSIVVGDVMQCLVKRAYVSVSADADILPFDSVGAIKQAMIAVFYEDQGDASTAANYWGLAVAEADLESKEYRGTAYPVFTFSDPAFDSVNKSVY